MFFYRILDKGTSLIMSEDRYYLNSEDFFANNFSIFAREKNNYLYGEECVEVRTKFPLKRLMSARELQLQLKSPLVMLTSCVGSLVSHALIAAKNIILGLVNILFWDLESVDDFFIKAFIDVIRTVYFAFHAIFDTSDACLMLVTQLLISGYVAVTASEYETEINLDDDQSTKGFADAFLGATCSEMNIVNLQTDGLTKYLELSELGYFEPFHADIQTHLKAPFLLPFSYLTLSCVMTIGIVKQVVLAVANVVVFDFSQAWVDLQVAWHDFESALYSVASAIIETLNAFVLLATRSIATAYVAAVASDSEGISATNQVYLPGYGPNK